MDNTIEYTITTDSVINTNGYYCYSNFSSLPVGKTISFDISTSMYLEFRIITASNGSGYLYRFDTQSQAGLFSST